MSEQIPGDRFFEFARGQSHAPLTDDQKQILDFGRRVFPTIGHRENAIMEEFGYPSHTYLQKLLQLRHHPEAVEYAPEVISRMNSHTDRPLRENRPYGIDRMSRG